MLARSRGEWHDPPLEVLVGNTLRLIAFTASVATAVVIGCGDDKGDDGSGLPPRTSGNKDAGSTSSTSSSTSSGSTDTDSGSGYDCSNHASVDDRPACDQCARAKCCEWITKCDQSAQCKAVQNCLKDCANDDFVCILGCQSQGGTGAEYLQELGACAQNECKSECPSSAPDGGFDGGF
jgi:hypothetical protein